jgi:hypothetical protein
MKRVEQKHSLMGLSSGAAVHDVRQPVVPVGEAERFHGCSLGSKGEEPPFQPYPFFETKRSLIGDFSLVCLAVVGFPALLPDGEARKEARAAQGAVSGS